MKKEINVRSMAITAVDLISNNKAFSNEIINDNLHLFSDYRDESLYRELVYGVTENLYYIDYIIGMASKIKLKKLEKLVLNALRVGVYELIFLRIEEYATVNEIVKIVKKKKGQKASNYTNGVLRNIVRNKDEFTDIKIKDKKLKLSIKYSFHPDIIEYLSNYYGDDELEKLLIVLTQRPEMSIRVNDLLTNRDDLSSDLASIGIKTRPSNIAKDGLIIENPVRVTFTEEFKKGYFTIQDQGSIMVSEILNPSPNSRVLDLCAAPGSKSTHLGQICKDKSKIIANDISTNKLSKIRENFDRLQLSNYEIKNYDARQYIEEFKDSFDYVLVDAPCSGLGVIRRKPEIKLFRSLDEIKELAKIQADILSNGIKYLKKGGYLVYSTCTMGQLENEDVVNKVLNDNKNIEIVPINGCENIQLQPNINGSDVFFICKLTKN